MESPEHMANKNILIKLQLFRENTLTHLRSNNCINPLVVSTAVLEKLLRKYLAMEGGREEQMILKRMPTI